MTYTSKQHDFGIFDPKNREVGARVGTRQVEATAEAREYIWALDGKPGRHGFATSGTFFVLATTATRGGAAFGASTPPRHFTTAALRDAAIEKYLAGAYKRAEKNFPFNPDQV